MASKTETQTTTTPPTDETANTEETTNESGGDIIFDGNNPENDAGGDGGGGRESLGLGDLVGGNTSDGEFVYLNKGEEMTLEVAEIEKNHDAPERFQLSSVEWSVEITDADGDTFTVPAWTVLGGIKAAYREAMEQTGLDGVDGLILNLVNHETDGEYTVRWKVEGMDQFQEVDMD